MEGNKVIEWLGMIAASTMPLWNIPLIVKIIQRKSSNDISILWVVGVWLCILGMLPSALITEDKVLKCFGIANSIFFSAVLYTVLKYRRPG